MMKLFWPTTQKFDEAISTLHAQKVQQPFSDDVLGFIQYLSKRFIKMRHAPEVVALGFWLRKANIEQMKEEFTERNNGKLLRARGIVFHIAPSNVDTIFVYSWLLSLLAGNKNVIRLSSKVEVNEVLQVILDVLQEFEPVGKATVLCTYDHEEEATKYLSQICHTRVIWGGDETVKAIRKVPLAPLANELAFPDRFSLAVLNGEKVAELDEKELENLLEQFYNDVFWFDQMACSSPRLVIWQGQAPVKFWSKFEEKIKQKRYELLAATQVLKYTTSMQLAAENFVSTIQPSTYFSRVQLADVPTNVREQHCGGGLFYEYTVEQLMDIADIIVDKDQTIAYFGFDQYQLVTLVNHLPSRGIDRIVPIGQALNFDGVWDGQNFLTSFTREVVIK